MSKGRFKDQNVLIIGGSFCGFKLARSLYDDFQVTVVDTKDYFEYVLTNYETLVDIDHIQKICIPYEQILKGHENKFKFIQGTLTKVNQDDSVEIQQNGATIKIEYDILIIATGSSNPFPWKSSEEKKEGRVQSFGELAQKVKNADSILVVGAGFVGVEVMGTIADAYPDKKLGLISSSETILPGYNMKSQKYCQNFFEKKKVKLYFNTKYDDQFTDNYSLILMSTGNKYHTEFMKENFSDCIAENGQIKVNQYFQIAARKDVNAIPLKQNMFAFGDIHQSCLGEPKNLFSAMNIFAPRIIQNIYDFAGKKGFTTSLPSQVPVMAMIQLGKSDGNMQINGFQIGKPIAKDKAEFQGKVIKTLLGDKKVIQELDGFGGFIGSCCYFWCQYICCFCPCSMRWN